MSLDDDGFLIVPAAFDVSPLREQVAWLYDALDHDRITPATVPTSHLVRTHREWDGLQLDDAYRLLHDRDALDGALSTASLHVDQELRPALADSFFRRLGKNVSARAPWHRDSDAVDTRRYQRCISVWLPLTLDDDAPMLELISGSHIEDVPVGPDQRHADESACQALPGAHIIPALTPGDALLMSDRLVHRTQLGRSGARLTCELRFAA